MDPPPTKSHLNHVVLDGVRGNSWEEGLAQLLERDERVQAYVKNERLGFTIPYVHEGRTHEYVPDFLVRLVPEPDDVERTLIVEVSGTPQVARARRQPRPTPRETSGARRSTTGASSGGGATSRSTTRPQASALLDEAIENLYADRPDHRPASLSA